MSSTQHSAPTMRRALRRAADGVSLDVTEASILLAARGADLDQQCRIAGHVRDQGLATAGLPGLVTYSRKVFIPLTRLRRDRCHYCTFATTPNRVPAAFLDIDQVAQVAQDGAALGCKEALFTLGAGPKSAGPPHVSGWTSAAMTRRCPTSAPPRSPCRSRPG